MIQTRKKLSTKLVTALTGIMLLTGFMFVGFGNNSSKILAIAQANSVEDLNITDQQKTKIETIFRLANDQIKQLKENAYISRSPFAAQQRKQQLQELFKEIQTIRTAALGRVRNQLTPTQQASFDQFTARIKESGESRTELLKKLELTQQQQRTFAKAVEQSKVQTWDVLGDSTLSNEQKVIQIKKMKQDSQNTIREQLSTEQQVKFDIWRQQQQKNSVF